MGKTTGSVTVTAKRLLEEAVKKSGRRSSLQLGEPFVRIQTPIETKTQLAYLYEQGEVAMKLYLTLLMLTRVPPHEMYRIVPDHYWAEMLGYEELNEADPIPGNGTRRVKRAMATLAKPNGWIMRTRVPGRGYKITVIHPAEPKRAPWIGLPLEFWSHGWINVMSARALFAFLLLQLVCAGKDDDHGAHVSSYDRQRFTIKDDTWQRGIKELEALGLVRSEMGDVAVDRWSTDLRERKVYYLLNSVLKNNDSPLMPVS
jgi:hypothetical protein